ncbi:hypothetical protein [Rhizobium sp. BK602]|uniref:hypothetical protein n=1 Tax=Rhizobium sp. BK602 TaxID=2586986 RepID=UPI0016143D64|nr:hypothetical protein [Rhizobium sp. BK602]MBB3612993.1 hypothetical protein [Rhizobium sp. BK602]
MTNTPNAGVIRTGYLHDVVNDTKSRAFCGPMAVAAITGEPISRVRDGYRFVRHGAGWTSWSRAPAIMRTTTLETEQVLRLFGYVGAWHKVPGRPTLAAYLEERTGLQRTHPTIVRVHGHVVAVSGWLFCDTFSGGEVVDADKAPGRRKRVKDVFVVTRRVPPAAHIPTKTPARTPRGEARKLDQLFRKAIKSETGAARIRVTSDGDIHIQTSRYGGWEWIGGVETVEQSLLGQNTGYLNGDTEEAAAYRAAVVNS